MLFGLAVESKCTLQLTALAAANILMHLLLDTITAGIQWAWPVSDSIVRIVQIPSLHQHWIWDFLFHWTFEIEIVIVIVAVFLFLQSMKSESVE